MKSNGRCLAVMCFLALACTHNLALAQESNNGVTTHLSDSGVTMHLFPKRQQSLHNEVIDFANAQPMPLPTVDSIPTALPQPFSSNELKSGYSPGNTGSGKLNFKAVKLHNVEKSSDYGLESTFVEPQEAGTSGHPYTTSRVNAYGAKLMTKYPYRAAGKLFYKIDSSTYVCSAALITRGVIVTAAHCVAEFGAEKLYSDFTFVPGYSAGYAPNGTWYAQGLYLKTSYYNGTESNYYSGTICENDVAVIILDGTPGDDLGWFGYSYGNPLTTIDFLGFQTIQITQLGYPNSHDSGKKMQRTDSMGYVDDDLFDNTIIGSRQTGGSSGGPWLANFGETATLSGISLGDKWWQNNLVGVTSWGYKDKTVKRQGASPFTSNNIYSLLNETCTYFPDNC